MSDFQLLTYILVKLYWCLCTRNLIPGILCICKGALGLDPFLTEPLYKKNRYKVGTANKGNSKRLAELPFNGTSNSCQHRLVFLLKEIRL